MDKDSIIKILKELEEEASKDPIPELPADVRVRLNWGAFMMPPQYRFTLGIYRPGEQIGLYVGGVKAPESDPEFPHTCPKCQGPAYIGFSSVNCKAKC